MNEDLRKDAMELTTRLEKQTRPTVSSKPKSMARQVQHGLPAMDLLFFLGVVRKGWFWIIPVGLLLAGLTCGAVLALFRPTYEARFRLEVDLANYVVFKEAKNYTNEFIDLQRAILLGNNVLEKSLADQSVSSLKRIANAKDPVQELRKNVKVVSVAGNRLMDVKFSDLDPTTAARVVNTVVDEYLRARLTMEQIRTSGQERKVMAALQKSESEVESAKHRVRDLSLQSVKSENVVGESISGRIDTTYLDDLRMKRMEMMSQLAILDLNFAEAKSSYESESKEDSSNKVPVQGVSDAVLENDLIVLAAKNRVTAAERDLEDLAETSNIGSKNPVYIRAVQKIVSMRAEVVNIKNLRRIELDSRGDLVPLDTRRIRLEQLQSQVSELRTRKATIENQIREYMVSLKLSNASSTDLQFAEADLEEWNAIRATVHNRQIELQTEREANDSVRELERAIPPRLPVEDLPYKQLAMAAAGGLFFPLLLGVLLEIRSRKVDDAGQLEARSQLAVLGEIAMIPVRSNRRGHIGSGNNRELRLFEESIDSLSTTLILRENLRDYNVFAVTSALSGEGKTSVSCQLAVSISRATGKRVLLIDGDLRSPDVHHVFGREMTAGLVGYLNGEIGWRDAVDSDWNDTVHLLSAGHLRGSPHRLLNGAALETLIAEARLDYDYIIIDTPPVLPASEALLFARSADVCLVCALRDRSRIDQLIQAYHRLESAGARVAGSVLSGVPSREYASYYGEYYTSKG